MTSTPVAAIMGGTHGIGEAIASAFLEAGYAVAVCGRSAPKRTPTNRFMSFQGDVRRKSDSDEFVRATQKRFKRLDVYVNCAGVSQWRSLSKIDETFLQEMTSINTFGAFWGCAAAAKALKRGGSIVNVSSLAGKRGSARNSVYCATKFAMNGLTQALAKELGPQGIRVNAVCPVYVTTPGLIEALAESESPAKGQSVRAYLAQFAKTQTALGRLPTAAEVAQTVLFLAGPKASAITGQCLNVDCGGPSPMSTLRIAAVIPARMASSRFPGKPLLSIHGLPMIEHVRRRALLCEAFSDVVVATCDQEIADVIQRNSGRVMMTSPHHPGATDRVAEAVQALDCTHVVNVQGDEILILPEDLTRLTQSIQAAPDGKAWNAIAGIDHADQLKDRSIVKCLVSGSNRILSCARDYSAIPLKAPFNPVRIILGILAYEKEFLIRFGKLPRTPYETAESIDQSRILEHDFELQGVPFTRGYPGINEPREVALVEEYLNKDQRQQAVLSHILSAAPTRA